MNKNSPPAVELCAISRDFGTVKALSNVSLAVHAGEILSIVGENGAGKSTLITIAAGALAPSAGELRVNGSLVSRPSSETMRRAGIAVAYQHPALPPDLTVLECFSLVADGFEGYVGRRKAAVLLSRIATPALQPHPSELIKDLNIAQRHVVEIGRALASDPRVIVFDEPTEPFQEADVHQLFKLILELKQQGKAVVYISHRLQDVAQISDRIAVLRDGRLVADRPAEAFSSKEVVELIVGHALEQAFPEKTQALDHDITPVLQIRDLSGSGFWKVSLAARRGEIVGVVGVEGQGQREFIRALAGAEVWRSGEIEIGGKSLAKSGRAAARSAGIAFVPDDRHHEGLFLSLSVRENFSIGLEKKVAHGGLMMPTLERQEAEAGVRTFQIKTADVETPVGQLSGGNQQKVLIGREVADKPRILIVDEPTKGVDVGARAEIYRQLRKLADEGIPVFVCSSDGVELQGLCDRVYVFGRGQVIAELAGDDVNDHNITAANLGATDDQGAQSGEPSRARDAKRTSFLSAGLSSVYMPVLVLMILIAVVGLAASSANHRFLTPFSLGPILLFVSALGIVSLAQLCTILLGEIDLSVGPLIGFVVVLSSYLTPEGAGLTTIGLGLLTVLLITAALGLLQGAVIETLGLPSMVVTLGTFFGFQGLSLLLRPLPGGTISIVLHDIFSTRASFFPIALGILIVVVLGLEFLLYRSRIGRSVRASGSDPASAFKLGVSRGKMTLLMFTLSGLLAGIAGLMIAGEIGVGVPTAGVDYTLMSITSVVVGGAAISGGRGSFLATAFGAALIQLIMSTTPFLRLGTEWNYWITGATTLVAAGLFTMSRKRSYASDAVP
ncbi:ATP-binding cassette domain-containing protein [Rhizobium sp. 2YAF20]|uniref:ATP-binding cassette domain-containing protein n=1 Tax=Rhizobium sp. 2YAF20 TaxID=3233027 RepID=UPI003F9CE5CD